ELAVAQSDEHRLVLLLHHLADDLAHSVVLDVLGVARLDALQDPAAVHEEVRDDVPVLDARVFRLNVEDLALVADVVVVPEQGRRRLRRHGLRRSECGFVLTTLSQRGPPRGHARVSRRGGRSPTSFRSSLLVRRPVPGRRQCNFRRARRASKPSRRAPQAAQTSNSAFSSSSVTRQRNELAATPSTTRWSYESATYMTGWIAMWSSPLTSTTTTRFWTSPMRRIPTFGWLMIAPPKRFPLSPGFETLNVAPLRSSIVILPARARFARSSIDRTIPRIPSSS